MRRRSATNLYQPASRGRSGIGGRRDGFTLVELLVTITIMMIVLGLTITAVNVTVSGDRVRSNARNIQSYLLAARDRATFAKAPRGVRFLLDTGPDGNPTTPATVRSMVYIGPLAPAAGTLAVAADGMTLTQTPGTDGGIPWSTLATRGLLVPGARIRIPHAAEIEPERGLWYVVDPSSNFAANQITLTSPHADITSDTSGVNYQLELTPGVLPNQEPMALSAGIVIDLNGSKIPPLWLTAQGMHRMDVMFSPRGSVIGDVAAMGLIHLLVADWGDVSSGLTIGDPAKQGDEALVSIFTRTGQVSSHAVDTESGNPYQFAETGEVAK